MKNKMKYFALYLILLMMVLPTTRISAQTMVPRGYAEVEFKVYPGGMVELAGEYLYNYTSPPSPYKGPSNISFGAEITKENSLFRVKADGSIVLSDEMSSQFPFNATKFYYIQDFSQNISRTTVNGSFVFPEKWSGPLLPPFSYEETSLDFNVFPLNSTDLTVSGEYSNGTYRGTLILHLIPGLTLGDVEINIEGDLTRLMIYDSIDVFYNQTLPISGFMPPDRAMIEEISRNKMYIDQMLYEATGGLVTCELYNVTVVQTGGNSDTIYFEIVLKGNFLSILAEIYKSLIEESAPYFGEEITDEMIRNLINTTMESIESLSFSLSYSRLPRELNFLFSSSVNWEKALNMTRQLIIDELPPEIQFRMKNLFNIRYARAESYTEEVAYENGRLQYSGNYVFKGDVNAEINLVKELFIDLAAESGDVPAWQLTFMNETEVVDVSGFKFKFNQESKQDMNVASTSFQGIKITPPTDPVNSTCFKLRRFFELAHGFYKPKMNEETKLIVKGESNGTHTVIPVIDPKDPEKPPEPDEVLSGNALIWNNIETNQLKGLAFRVHRGLAGFVAEKYVSPEKPYVINASDTANCQITVNSIQGSAIITVKNVTLPEGVNPPSETYRILGSYVEITAEGKKISGDFTIKMYYDPEALAESGVSEDSLKIYFWDPSAGEWTPVETHLNSEEHYVWANVDHLSIWVLMGELAAKPIWTEPWFITVVAIIVLVVILAIILAARRRVSR